MSFKIQHVPARKVAGFHLVGPWEIMVPKGFEQLTAWAERHNLNGEWLAVYYDDPDVVPAEKLRADTVLSVPEDFKVPENSEGVIITTIEAGTYAICHAKVENEAYRQAWANFFDQIKADGSYRPVGKPGYEIYLNDGSASGVWEIDMYIPVTKVRQQLAGTSLKVLFVAGFGPVTRDVAASTGFYQRVLGLPLQAMEDNEEYLATQDGALDGVKHFAIWPLAQAAQSCFGADSWPQELTIPQSWVEFEVENVGQATAILKQSGYRILVDDRMEPWGQTVSRLLSPEGLLVGLTMTPWLR